MNIFKAGLLAVFVFGCAGCADRGVFDDDYTASDDAGPPAVCEKMDVAPAQRADVKACIAAMMLVIDMHWARFAHRVNARLATNDLMIDTTALGLSTSAALAAPGTKNVLAAITAGLTPHRRPRLDCKLLESYTVQVLLLQMRKDRAAVAARITAHLAPDAKAPYASMAEAELDLMEYADAGSWGHAMTSLQTAVGR